MSTIAYNGSEYSEDDFKTAVNVVEQQNNVELRQRGDFLSELGKQYDGKRDIYDVLGYDEKIKAKQYRAKFERQDIARRIVELPARDTWKAPPTVSDNIDSSDETAFEKGIDDLDDRLQLWNNLTQADIASGIGEYGVMFLGLKDGQDLDEEVNESALEEGDLKYITSFAQDQIVDWETGRDKGLEPSHERYNKPVEYTIAFCEPDDDVTDSENQEVVHWTRCIHIAEGRVGSEIKGQPRLEPVYNRLDDIQKVLGSSAEMFWTGADQKYHFNVDTQDSTHIGNDQLENLDDEIQNLVHDLEKSIRTVNTDLEVIGGNDVNPEGVITEELKFIAGSKGIPKRILTGSERGELASSQDKANWYGKVEGRRETFAEPDILRQFIDRLLSFGLLPSVESYEVEWPNLFELTELEEAKVWKNRAQAGTTLKKMQSFAEPEELFEYMKTGDTPEFKEQVDPMQLPAAMRDQQFSQGQQLPPEQGQGEQRQGQSQAQGTGSTQTSPQDSQEASEATQNVGETHESPLVENLSDSLSRDMMRELLNRNEFTKEHPDNFSLNWTPAMHPRDENGRFVERQYPVPDDIVDMPTETIVRTLDEEVGGLVDYVASENEELDKEITSMLKEEEESTETPESGNEENEEEQGQSFNANAGSVVDTPDGKGVVVDVISESDVEEGEGIQGSDLDPREQDVYVVALVSGGHDFYTSDEIESASFDVEQPEETSEAIQSANARRRGIIPFVNTFASNDWSMPESWEESSRPARLILLDAWASMGGQFDCGGGCCMGELHSERLCAAMKDEVLGTELWRGGWV